MPRPPVTEAQEAPEAPEAPERGGAFHVRLPVFEGPFDLLLQLIGKHKLDVTEVALAQVTDEFLAHTRALGEAWDLGQTTEFLVVAATLLDLKVSRLLPGQTSEADEEDLALLEARDLLFARLLQYRAYKEAAALLRGMLALEERHRVRTAGLEPRFTAVLPEVVLAVDAEGLAARAAAALAPRQEPEVRVDHVHAPRVSVREQAALLLARLRPGQPSSFRALTADCASLLEVVARFLALLELYRERRVAFDQAEALAELQVRLLPGTGPDEPAAAGQPTDAEPNRMHADIDPAVEHDGGAFAAPATSPVAEGGPDRTGEGSA